MLGRTATLTVVDLGLLHLPNGALGACDPFVYLDGVPACIDLPPGAYPVRVTLAELDDPADVLNAYLTLLVDAQADEIRRTELPYDVGVDAGVVAFVDAAAAARMFRGEVDPEAIEAWGEKLHDPAHFRDGGVNVPLPGQDPANVVLCRSGIGDGRYPVVLGYDAQDRVVRVHIDLLLIDDPNPEPRRRQPVVRQKALTALLAALPALFWVAMAGEAGGSPAVMAIGALGWIAVALGIAHWLEWV